MPDENQATVRIDDVKLPHAIIAVKKIADLVAVTESGDIWPEGFDILDFQIDRRMATSGVENGLILGKGKMQ